jgi:7-carboxy-7-deazaguanine synthase
MSFSNASHTLRIAEIFYSLQGETSRVGIPTVFIRLTGCPLRCLYCDTAYAFTGGTSLSIAEILQTVATYPTRTVCITGGEPLAQKNAHELINSLLNQGLSISLETSGALDVSAVDPRVNKILDVKTPDSGEVSKNLYRNFDYLTPADEVKFVLCGEADYRWATHILHEYKLTEKCPILFSPAQGQLSPTELAEWILRDGLNVRLQVQLHKLLWGNQVGK